MPKKPHDEPIRAAAEHGEVVLEGPGGLVSSLTPAAASLSARRIASAARIARRNPDAETA